MRLEHIPILLGILVAIAGIALVIDAMTPDSVLLSTDRRRHARPARNHLGEALLGLGSIGVAAALIGRDSWRYGTVAVIAAVVFLAIGVTLNWKYVIGFMFGPAEAREEQGPRAPGL